MRRIVVVGASVAGVNAVGSIRAQGFDGELALVGAEQHLPYDRPPLSKEALRAGPSRVNTLLKPPGWYEAQQVDLRLGLPAVGLDAHEREVVLADGSRMRYDGLVLATGSAVRRLPGSDGEAPIHTLRSIADASALHDELRPGRHLAVIGAGFIGLEVAATARRLRLDVTVIEVARAPLARVVGDSVGDWFTQLHRRHGVTMHCGSAIERIERSTRGVTISLGNGTTVAADLVVAGVGVAPATGWLGDCGVKVGDGVRCDPALRTSLPDVVAAGDLARWRHPLFDTSLRVEQWRNAAEQGQHAARTLLGAHEPYARLPHFWSDQFDAKVHGVGIAAGADEVCVRRLDEEALSVVFGKAGVVQGALCVNAPRDLMPYRQAIQDRVAWGDLVSAAEAGAH